MKIQQLRKWKFAKEERIESYIKIIPILIIDSQRRSNELTIKKDQRGWIPSE